MAVGTRTFIQGPPDAGGKQVETEVFTVSSEAVHREIVEIAGRDSDALGDVINVNPGPNVFALLVRRVYASGVPRIAGSSGVGTSTTVSVVANPNRWGIELINGSPGAERISLGFGGAAVLDAGITLAVGESWLMRDRSFYTGAINTISDAGTAILRTQEWDLG